MKIYFETQPTIPLFRKAYLFCELPDYDEYPSLAFAEAVEEIAAADGFMVTESCEP